MAHRCMLLTIVATIALSFAAGQQANAQETVRVITDRTESHLKPLFDRFEKDTGIAVHAVYVDKGLMPRLEAQPTEADLVISKTAGNLERARRGGLLQAYDASVVEGLPEQFVDPDHMYVITSYRARGLYVSRERVDVADLDTYADLSKPEWKGKVAIRSGYHDYNVSLFCQMAEAEGIDAVRSFITGLKGNLARTPTGNDRAQVRAIYEGIADVSIGNSYYMGLMMARDDQRPWGLATDYVFPNQNGAGTYVLRAAAGLTKADRSPEAASRLLAYLLDDFAQYYLASALHAYPVVPGLPISSFNKTLAQAQEEVEDGVFKARFVPLRAIDQHRDAVIAILNEVGFDQ